MTKIMTTCQFLLGKVLLSTNLCNIIIVLHILSRKCQFLLGKVLQLQIKSWQKLAGRLMKMCQFLLGKVLREARFIQQLLKAKCVNSS